MITIKKVALFSCVTLLSFGLASCAGYSQKTAGAMTKLQSGSPAMALAEIEKNYLGKDKDLLFYLEVGELQRLNGDYEASKATLLQADALVAEWERQAKTNPDKLLGNIGSVLINDTTRRYDGRDYEKVMLAQRLALDHIALGDWASARTEIKKMHEREAIIANFRAREIESAKGASEKKGLKATSFKDIDGYPVETLEDPAVRALVNSYESAVSNYLAGFTYEALGEPSLAAAGYRKATEMAPGNKMLEESLGGLDARVSRARSGQELTDVLVLVEVGSAPAIQSRMLPIVLPIPGKNGLSLVATPVSWPVISESGAMAPPPPVSIGQQAVTLSSLTSVTAMAKRALSDEMPGIIARSSIRAITRGAAQKAMQDNSQSMGGYGALLSLAAGVTAIATEVADERTWRTVPGSFYAARVSLPAGAHTLTVGGPGNLTTQNVNIEGPHAVVVARLSGTGLYVSSSKSTPAFVQASLQ